MLVNREVTSMVTSRIFEGSGVGKERRMVRKWLESLMCEGRDWTMGWRWKSTKAEIRSVTVKGSNNGTASVIRFMDFREEIEGGG